MSAGVVLFWFALGLILSNGNGSRPRAAQSLPIPEGGAVATAGDLRSFTIGARRLVSVQGHARLHPQK